MQSVQAYSIPLKATGEPETRSISYKYIWFFYGSVSFQFSLNGTTFNPGYAGMKLGPLDEQTTISLRSNNGNACSVVFYASDFPIEFFPTGFDIPTYLIGTPVLLDSTLVQSQIFTGLNGYNIRKQVIISNLSNMYSLDVLDAFGNIFDVIPIGTGGDSSNLNLATNPTTKTYVTAGAFQLSGSYINAQVGELFFQLI